MWAWIGGFVLAVGGVLGAGDGPTVPTGVTRIEEDWELEVREPDVENCGPQITTVMSPMIEAPWIVLTFNLNYCDDPFGKGGMQIRLWSNKRVITQKSLHEGQMTAANETVRWTQSIDLTDGLLTMEVKNGQSATWGEFGGEELRMHASTSLANLDGYRVDESVANSGCGYQSNRVSRMTLKRVRYYVGDELALTDSTPKVLLPTSD